MGTTVGTNALLEREGNPSVLVTTKGFGDLLEIGNQARPNIFDLQVRKASLLYSRVVEVEERVRPRLKEGADTVGTVRAGAEEESNSNSVIVEKSLDLDSVRKQLQAVYDENGDYSLAICLLHSYVFSEHEAAIAKVAKQIGFKHVSTSSELMPMKRAVPRGHTMCVDAYLSPKIQTYLENFSSGFEDGQKFLQSGKISFMQSDGGLTSATKFSGFKAILSGPAGGVVGYARTTPLDDGDAAAAGAGGDSPAVPTSKNLKQDSPIPVIGFDMGGTSTDVSRFDGVNFELVFETETAGIRIQAPQLDINTVAAGGGSRLFFRNNCFDVGPESAKAHPGPVCYRKKGYLAVTDANLVLGRVLPNYFPKIFGPNEDLPLDAEGSRKAMEVLGKEISASSTGSVPAMSVEEIAEGFIRVANEKMCRPIRELSESRG